MAKILIVDDDPDVRDIYEETLSEAGYQVELAVDGQEGLDKILKGGYDLILLDIMMPKVDGLTVLKKVKEGSPWKTPIVVLSQLNEEKVQQDAKDLGAKDYLIKSDLTPDQIVSKINIILQS